MSYRATYTTQFLYKHGEDKELAAIKQALEKYCRSVIWQGRNGIGYFHGIISGLYESETRDGEKEIVSYLKARGIKIKIIHEI